MAEDHGRGENDVAHAPVLPPVDVAAADAGVLDGDDDFVGGGDGGEGSFLEMGMIDGAEDEGEVLSMNG